MCHRILPIPDHRYSRRALEEVATMQILLIDKYQAISVTVELDAFINQKIQFSVLILESKVVRLEHRGNLFDKAIVYFDIMHN